MVANDLYRVGLDIGSVVGAAASAEFASFVALYHQLPDVASILNGNGNHIMFPTEPSLRYAITIALAMRANGLQESYRGFQWIAEKASTEWVQLFVADLFRLLRSRNELNKLAALVDRDTRLKKMFQEYMKLLTH
jgi:hypothetical protein